MHTWARAILTAILHKYQSIYCIFTPQERERERDTVSDTFYQSQSNSRQSNLIISRDDHDTTTQNFTTYMYTFKNAATWRNVKTPCLFFHLFHTKHDIFIFRCADSLSPLRILLFLSVINFYFCPRCKFNIHL